MLDSHRFLTAMLLAAVLFFLLDIAIVAVIIFIYRRLAARIAQAVSREEGLKGKLDKHLVQLSGRLDDQIAQAAFQEKSLKDKLAKHHARLNNLKGQVAELNSLAKGLSGRLDSADRFIELIDVLRDDE